MKNYLSLSVPLRIRIFSYYKPILTTLHYISNP
jgi:hypothetical protein